MPCNKYHPHHAKCKRLCEKKAFILSVILLLSGSLQAQFGSLLNLDPHNPHYFLYKNKPLVIVGSGEHYGSVINSHFDYDTYLKTIYKDGLNVTRLFMGAYYEKPGAFGIERNTLAPDESQLLLPWQRKNGKYNLTKWNSAYFMRLHDFMKKAARYDIIVEINLFSSYYGAGWSYHPFNGNNNINQTLSDLSANKVNTLENGNILTFQEAYVRKLINELNKYDNLYFEIQNEPWTEQKDTVLVWNDFISADDLKQSWNNWKNSIEVVSQKSRNWQKVVSAWITDEEKKLPKKHLISQNVSNFKMPVFLGDSNISIYTFHYAYPEAAVLNYGVNKVIGFNETGFAGRDDATYRRQAWRFMMNGGGLFNHLDYSFTVDHEDGTDTTNNAPGGGSPALRKYFGVLKKYFDDLQLSTLYPEKNFLLHTEGAFAYSMKDAENWIVYTEPLLDEPVKIHLKIPAGNYSVEWTDVLTGEKIKSEKIKVTSGLYLLISPEGIGDKVVKLKHI